MRYFKIKTAPGREYVKVICDVCRGEFHQKDLSLVTNKYSTQYGQMVCKADLDDINEQVLPNNIHERPISSPELLRPDREPQFSSNPNDDRLPSAPLSPQALVNPINDTVDLYWSGPEDNGSSIVTGYVIERSDPQFSTYMVLTSNTHSISTYYQDVTAIVTTEYSYRIAAINSFGTGPYSKEFFWPVLSEDGSNVNYLVLSQNGYNLITSDTELPIRLN